MADASPDEWEPLTVEQQEKVAILGGTGLQPSERTMNPTDPVLLFSGEKNQKVWEELLHHFRITSATVMSPGVTTLLRACMNRGVKCSALCRNEEHLMIVKWKLREYVMTETATNEEFPCPG